MTKFLYCLIGVALATIGLTVVHKVHAQSSPQTRILLPFVTGSDAGYTSLLLINNTSVDPYGTTSAGGTCAVAAEPYTGGSILTGSLGTIPAGQSMVFTEAQIGTATGLSLANSGQRAYLLLTCNFAYAHAQVLLVNPSGVVTPFTGYIIPPNRGFNPGPEQLLP